MSYILEALKKSQQERELGQIPTLDSGTVFGEDKEPPPAHHWGLLAVGLAALAVVIALYAALRGDAPAPGAAVPAPAPPPAEPRITPAVPAPVASQPLVEAPPPKQTVRTGRPEVVTGPRPGGAPPLPEPVAEPELQRQFAAPQADPDEAEEPAGQPRPVPIPPDLLEDIESFKQQVRRGQGGGAPAAPGRGKPLDNVGDPTRLRLTPQQQARLPAFVMTVHVYDAEASKRFVVINSLRYAEGEETREGLRVERILHDGAVLGYQGNPFYVPR